MAAWFDPIVEAKRLFVNVAEQVDWLDRNVGPVIASAWSMT